VGKLEVRNTREKSLSTQVWGKNNQKDSSRERVESKKRREKRRFDPKRSCEVVTRRKEGDTRGRERPGDP